MISPWQENWTVSFLILLFIHFLQEAFLKFKKTKTKKEWREGERKEGGNNPSEEGGATAAPASQPLDQFSQPQKKQKFRQWRRDARCLVRNTDFTCENSACLVFEQVHDVKGNAVVPLPLGTSNPEHRFPFQVRNETHTCTRVTRTQWPPLVQQREPSVAQACHQQQQLALHTHTCNNFISIQCKVHVQDLKWENGKMHVLGEMRYGLSRPGRAQGAWGPIGKPLEWKSPPASSQSCRPRASVHWTWTLQH